MLSAISENQPQADCLAFVSDFENKWSRFMITIISTNSIWGVSKSHFFEDAKVEYRNPEGITTELNCLITRQHIEYTVEELAINKTNKNLKTKKRAYTPRKWNILRLACPKNWKHLCNKITRRLYLTGSLCYPLLIMVLRHSSNTFGIL